MKRLLIATSVAMLVGAAGGAFAGEVKGPPGTIDNTNRTGAPANANSNCAYSGLNDFDSSDPGQIDSIVQTVADAWKFYGFEPGSPLKDGACRGGTNEDRQR